MVGKLRSGTRHGNSNVNSRENRPHDGKKERHDGRASAGLKCRTHAAIVAGLRGTLRLIVQVNVRGKLEEPGGQRDHGRHRCPRTQAAM